jgi:DMSO/TMAO reductase YedYZ molybdopterin-dependent catalytic subunit
MSDATHRDTSTAAQKSAAHAPDTTRRRFLMAFGAGAAGAASAPLLAAPAAIVEQPQTAPQAQGYRETDHVRNYYATTRL